MKKVSVIIAFLMVLAVTGLAAAGPKYRFFDGSGHLDPAVVAALELTQEQTEKIQGLHETAKKEILPLKAQFATKRAEMRLLWTQTTLDADKIKATQKELQALGIQMRDIRTNMRIAFRNLLTPEQTTKLLAMDFKRGKGFKRGGGSGKWGGSGKDKGNRYGGAPWCGKSGTPCADCPGYRR